MSKAFIQFSGFIISFILIFAYLQPVFIPKSHNDEALARFYNEPADSLDIIMIGASTIRHSVLPSVLWEEAGIASYNLSMDSMHPAAGFYLLREALRFQAPAMVIVDAKFLFNLASFDDAEFSFRYALDHMRWSQVKLASVLEILASSEKQTLLDYLFPLLRYHNRKDLREADYKRYYQKQRSLDMGGELDLGEIYTELMRPDYLRETETVPEASEEYLTKIISLCRERGIEIVMINTPTCLEDRLTVAGHQALQEFAQKQEVELLDFNTPELFNDVRLTVARDFIDENHTNISGGIKVSTYLAQYLRERFDLPDRRETDYDPHWDDVLKQHHERYARLVSTFPKNRAGIRQGGNLEER